MEHHVVITTGQIFWKDFAYATDKCSGITLNVHLVFLGEHLWFPVKKFTVLSIPGKLKTIWTMTIWLRFACSSLFFSLPVYWSVSETLRSEAAWRYAGGDSYLWLDRVPTSLGEPDYRPPPPLALAGTFFLLHRLQPSRLSHLVWSLFGVGFSLLLMIWWIFS